jgi:starch-binding outer membrane protein, SusD/RagB family
MTNILRTMRGPILMSAALLGLAGCKLDVVNPSVIDASTFNPNADGQTLALSAQTNMYIAFQSVALFGGLISEEVWTGAIRLQTQRTAARTFLATDDINADFFSPLSLAVASNENAVKALATGPGAATDLNLARSAMNLGFSLEIMAETMCAGDIQGGPQLTDTQLSDSAIARFSQAITVATAAGSAGAEIVNGSNVGLARSYLQIHDYAHAATAAALVPASFVLNVITTANVATQGTLGNTFWGNSLEGQIVAPKLYRIGDPRLPMDSTTLGHTLNALAYVIQAKFKGYADPIRLASGLEAQYILAEANLETGNPTTALTLIAARRAANGQPAFTGSGTPAILAELMNQRAREFWMEAKKLGDLRRNPSVPLTSVLMDPVGAPFYTSSGPTVFGSNLCAPIPPEETSANHNLTPTP